MICGRALAFEVGVGGTAMMVGPRAKFLSHHGTITAMALKSNNTFILNHSTHNNCGLPHIHFCVSCKMRPKNSSGHYKKGQSREFLREHPVVDMSVNNMKDLDKNSIDLQTTVPNDLLDKLVLVSVNPTVESFANVKCATEWQYVPEKREDDDDNRQTYPGILVEDLMTMIEDAEENILLPNEVCIHSIEEHKQICTMKEALQGEVNILLMHLAEADAGLKVPKSVKNELLESEILSLKRKMAERAMTYKHAPGTEGQYGILQEHAGASKSHIEVLSAVVAEIGALKEENNSYKEELTVLRLKLANFDEKDRLITETHKEIFFEGIHQRIETKLAIAKKNISELANVKAEREALQKKIDHLQTGVERSSLRMILPDDILVTNQALQGKIDRLKAGLEKVEVDKELLEQSLKENELLREQVESLKLQLLESDQGIQSQLQIYQDEVEAFQASLKQLKKKNKMQTLDKPVQDFPWEFWCNLLLSLDGWMLEKKMAPEDANWLRDKAWCRDAHIQDAYAGCPGRSESGVIASLLKLTKTRTRPELHIIHIAAEMAPVAKVKLKIVILRSRER